MVILEYKGVKMLEINCLAAMIPMYGRFLTSSEAATINRKTRGGYGVTTYIVAATDDGKIGFVMGATSQLFILTIKQVVAGSYAVLGSPVVGEGRWISQYESQLLRRAGVPCSTIWWLLPCSDRSGGAVRRGGAPGVVLLPRGGAVPVGCCCWACAAAGCSVRRSVGPGGER